MENQAIFLPIGGMKVGSNPLAEAELRLLSTLVGAGQSTRKGKKEEGEFKLNLFNDEDEEQEYHERYIVTMLIAQDA